MKTLTICGSMRFSNEMHQIAWELETMHGFNILQCVYGDESLDSVAELLKMHDEVPAASLKEYLSLSNVEELPSKELQDFNKFFELNDIRVFFHKKKNMIL